MQIRSRFDRKISRLEGRREEITEEDCRDGDKIVEKAPGPDKSILRRSR